MVTQVILEGYGRLITGTTISYSGIYNRGREAVCGVPVGNEANNHDETERYVK